MDELDSFKILFGIILWIAMLLCGIIFILWISTWFAELLPMP